MKIVTTRDQLISNLKRLEQYLEMGSTKEQEEAKNFIQRGTCFIAYNDGSRMRFAPSRFIGYENNTFDKHSGNFEKHGGVTNPAISRLLNAQQPQIDAELEEQYKQYCIDSGIELRPKGSFGVSRKYWTLEDVEAS